ncbi:MAG: hypothetical protein EA344_12680 [Alkalicoccus sp.]|nr:MAG: hypothetical protein EA344_12680 [Alkalicoccus sp.]
MKRRNFLFLCKKRSENRPVEEGDWKIPQGAAYPKISSTASLPVGSEVFLQPSTANFNIVI